MEFPYRYLGTAASETCSCCGRAAADALIERQARKRQSSTKRAYSSREIKMCLMIIRKKSHSAETVYIQSVYVAVLRIRMDGPPPALCAPWRSWRGKSLIARSDLNHAQPDQSKRISPNVFVLPRHGSEAGPEDDWSLLRGQRDAVALLVP